MRTIVVLLIAALVLVPTLAHAQASPAAGLALVAIPVLVIALIALMIQHEKKHPRETEAGEPTALPSQTDAAPVVASDR